jgi:hypothetical protein
VARFCGSLSSVLGTDTFAAAKPARLPMEAAGFALFSTVSLWLVFHHSPWFDEAQALLIARDAGRLADHLKY